MLERAPHFVGREKELQALSGWLETPTDRMSVMSVVGAAGSGKSTLCRHFLREVPLPVHTIYCDQTILHVRQVVAELEELGLTQSEKAAEPCLVWFDAYEQILPFSREILLDALSPMGPALWVLLSSRTQLPEDVRTALEMSHSELSLSDFSLSETELFLRGRDADVDVALAQELTHGHPLTLALLSERPDVDWTSPFDGPLLATLAKRVVSDVPSEQHREAMLALSLSLVLDEEMLGAMLGQGDVRHLFDWLLTRPFVQTESRGLSLQGSLRDILHGDLVMRYPTLLRRMTAGAVEELVARMADETLQGRRQLLIDGLYMRRDLPLVSGKFQLEPSRASVVERGSSADARFCEKVVEDWEGAAEAQLFRAQYEADPEGFFVLRQADPSPAGFVTEICPDKGAEVLTVDPLYVEGLRRFQQHTGLTQPDRYQRWFGTTLGHQEFGPTMSMLMLSGPNISLSLDPIPLTVLLVTHGRQRWLPLTSMMSIRPLGDEFEDEERAMGFWLLDLRGHFQRSRRDVALSIQRHMLEEVVGVSSVNSAAVIVESESLREALRDLHKPVSLARSSLASAAQQSGFRGLPAVAVRSWIVAGIQALCERPAERELGELLFKTYVEAPTKQYAVAVALDIPWGTYRHRLRRAIKLLSTELAARHRLTAKPA